MTHFTELLLDAYLTLSLIGFALNFINQLLERMEKKVKK